jgi:hypothetical protein
VALQIANVLKDERSRPAIPDDSFNFEEQISLMFIREPVGTTKTPLLADSRNGKRLAGKTRGQNVVQWDLSRLDHPNVAGVGEAPEISEICLLAKRVPLA